MNGRYPDHQPPQPPVFPSLAGAFPGYIPGTHSYLSSSPRFPYNISTRTHQGYIPGSVVHGPSPYITQDRSNPPSVFSRSSHEFPHVPERRSYVPDTVPERRSYVPDAPRRYHDLDNTEDHDPVVFNAGFTFRLGQEAVVHKHVDVQPAYSIPEAQSANLSRQIDKFLKKSDHTLDRYSTVIKSRSSSRVSGQRGRSLTPGGTLDTSPDRSLNLSCRAQRSTSAASIAVKAEKHLEALSLSMGPKARKTAPIAEREEDDLGNSSSDSFDEFDTDEDLLRSGEVFDISDDTSADLSKV
ncbi:hypothetical protein Pmani_002863 [Petrolisthes manimaculis]|uniref:Uncharacterized protein n=1 Tax=Petrolisthes manimaculis TaxID=1843537 RepID=A0AAE1QGY9_9EUCA|nr:hypothetical protein Pmani_002863 [Petrolisthes manimaculis]